MTFVPLACHSHFSLLWGTASPEALCRRAAESGVRALALTDREGLYGAISFWEAARDGVRPILGAQFPPETCRDPAAAGGRARDSAGSPNPGSAGSRRGACSKRGAACRRTASVLLLVAEPRGWRRLSRLLTCHHQAQAKSRAPREAGADPREHGHGQVSASSSPSDLCAPKVSARKGFDVRKAQDLSNAGFPPEFVPLPERRDSSQSASRPWTLAPRSLCPPAPSACTPRREGCTELTAEPREEAREPGAFSLFHALCEDRDGLVVLSPDTDFLEALARASGARDLGVALYPFGPQRERIRFSRRTGIPLVAVAPVYFLDPVDHAFHRLLRAVSLCTKLDRVPDSQTAPEWAWFQGPERWASRYLHCPEALQAMERVAKRCRMDEPPWGSWVFPCYEGLCEEEAFALLEKKARSGALARYGPHGAASRAVEERLRRELGLIRAKGFASYFLVVEDIVKHFPITCGRGSAAASLVSYCLGITHVDPIRHDLFFERFLNEGRADPPDIDVDFPWDERDAVLSYVLDKYGPERCAMVANHVGFGLRAAIREAAKVYGVPEAEIQERLRNLRFFWDPSFERDRLERDPALRGRFLAEPWPEILGWAGRLEGMPRHLSVHCGGVVVTPDPLPERVPIERAAKGVPVIQWEKDGAEAAGLVKIDLLGNRSLAVIRDTLGRLRARRADGDGNEGGGGAGGAGGGGGLPLSYSSFDPVDDPATQEMLARGDTVGVFYVESPAMRQLLKKTGRGDFAHLVVLSSIIRPAANEFIREYVRRDRGGAYEPLHPLLETILKETHGILCYQEDVSRVAMALAGFDAVQADELRKILSKKHRHRRLSDLRGRFFEGAAARGVPRPVVEEVWRMILSFQGYSFCKPHSASYAMVSFKSCYLKAHHPAEFMAAVLSNQGGYYTTQAYLSEARRMGLELLPPDVNQSEYAYTGAGRTVRVGLMQLKGVRRDCLEALLEERRRQGPFRSLEDLLGRVEIDPSEARILVKAGCLDSVAASRSRPELLWQVLAWEAARRGKSRRTNDKKERGRTKGQAPPAEELHPGGRDAALLEGWARGASDPCGRGTSGWGIVGERNMQQGAGIVGVQAGTGTGPRHVAGCGLPLPAGAGSRLRAAGPMRAESLFEETFEPPRAAPYDEVTCLRHELQTLGVLVSRHPLELFRPWVERFPVVPAARLAEHAGRTVLVAGWFVTAKTVLTRKDEPMEFVSFEDTSALYETTFFPRAFDRFSALLAPTRPFILRGRVEEDFGAVSLTVEEVLTPQAPRLGQPGISPPFYG